MEVRNGGKHPVYLLGGEMILGGKQDRIIQHDTVIDSLVMPDEARALGIALPMPTAQVDSGVDFPAAFRIGNLPAGNLQGASIIMRSGAARGQVLSIVAVIRDLVMIGFGAGTFEAVATIRAGDAISIDNSIYLATQTYHRHQLPGPDFYTWDQFRTSDGRSIYPQRPVQLRENYEQVGAAPRQDGQFSGKMIIVQALMDEAAYPYHADWYRTKVKQALGKAFEERYRLYFIDPSLHTPPERGRSTVRPAITTRVINYGGALQRALLDLANWVEKGIDPPASTSYRVVDGQVVVPPMAKRRKGIQPVVTLKVNRGERADVKVGERVRFNAVAEVPPGGGRIVSAEWDFDGAGDYPLRESFEEAGRVAERVTLSASHVFTEPGTYFPALRVASHPDGDTQARWARVMNLGRVRVVVR